MKTVNFGITNYKGLALDSGTHFFGTPFVTEKIARIKFEKEQMFIGQINFSDLAAIGATKIPERGMLYIFYDLYSHKYTTYFTKKEGSIPLDGFNEKFNLGGRFTTPLSLIFTLADESDVFEYGNKLFAEIPQMVKDRFPKYKSGYKAIITLCPDKFAYFDKAFLTGAKNYSLVIAAERDLKKGNFEKVITINV